MLVLALDTSAGIAVALVDDGRPVATRALADQRHHAELLSPLITEVLSEAGVRPRDLSAVAVGTGPAPFTGLRAGLVTARTLAYAIGVPVHGVGSLEVLAAEALRDAPQDEVLVVGDARRHEVYLGRFRSTDGDVVAVGGLDVVHPQDVVRGSATVLAGPAAATVADLVGLPAGEPVRVDPVTLARLAGARAARGLDQPTEPLYLRRPDAVPPGARKRATG